MSTVNELIAKVEDDMSRQDLADRLLAQFPQCLVSAHAASTFARDMKTKSFSGFALINNVATLSTITNLPRLRKVKSVKQYSSFTLSGTTVIPGTEILPNNFKDMTDANSQFNYYGFSNPQMFSLLGSSLTISGVDSSALALSVTGNFFPTFALNTLSGEYESDSWIMLEFPQLIEAHLRSYVARIIGDPKILSIEQNNVGLLRRELITTYAGEIVS